jgi:cell wall-associated NlpC family hydrolase
MRPGIFACPNPTGHPSQADDEGSRMTALNRSSRPACTRLSRLGAASVLTAAAVAVPPLLPDAAQPAEAATLAVRALDIAASKQGSPYQWGATGPYRFDCSGLTLYSFKSAGKKLPRTAAAQYNSTRHISADSRRAGDLVFFHFGSSSASVYHVGIYAGGGRIWHAPKTGARVRLEKIWTRSVWYGRVR